MCQKQKQKQKDGIWAGLSITVVQYIVMTQKPTNRQTYKPTHKTPRALEYPKTALLISVFLAGR